MSSTDQLEGCIAELTSSARSLLLYGRNAGIASSGPQLRIPVDAPDTVHQARRTVLANIFKLTTLLGDPVSLLQQMALQIQLLACLQWLSCSQVLICLPLEGSFPVKDLAQLCGVSETQLSRVLRLTATSGFLQEPQPGQIMHTHLSSSFVSQRRFRDATLFIAECWTPSALRMASVTHPQGNTPHVSSPECAYNLAFSTPTTFRTACSLAPKLQRQWSAYLQFTGYFDDNIVEVLTRLDWGNLGESCIVESRAESANLARLLARIYPALRFIVQVSGNILGGYDDAHESSMPQPTSPQTLPAETHDSRISVETCPFGAPQPILDAAAYILHLPSPLSPYSASIRSFIIKELQSYVGILCANRAAILILTARFLPPPGSVNLDVEAISRVRSLTLFQLVNEREAEVADIEDLVNSVGDGLGRLVVVDKLRTRNNLPVGLAVKYQEENGSSL
ncbi:hypothetical protein N7462_000557 [Penicillium macrosclerotiorum]|uniref:uncharacterized protein n=1 Tax=Penicillium macrosclerotiorum TaxID=303699 RepID=UPI002546A2C9|nr:uncharacterized protein N7462_000557 [Penicillium macrosclerotiorum]KAJ5698552.1 hypothetical protein N7462_000557 [Penicillium macrosclerotiorum]